MELDHIEEDGNKVSEYDSMSVSELIKMQKETGAEALEAAQGYRETQLAIQAAIDSKVAAGEPAVEVVPDRDPDAGPPQTVGFMPSDGREE